MHSANVLKKKKFQIAFALSIRKSLVGIGSKKTLICELLPRGSLQGEASYISTVSLMKSPTVSKDNSGNCPPPYHLEKALGFWFIFVWLGGLGVAALAACALP